MYLFVYTCIYLDGIALRLSIRLTPLDEIFARARFRRGEETCLDGDNTGVAFYRHFYRMRSPFISEIELQASLGRLRCSKDTDMSHLV